MQVSECIDCKDFPCLDIDKGCYLVPKVEIEPENILTIMISEASPKNPSDYFYAQGTPFFLRTTIQAFDDAGFGVSSMQDILNRGFYVTTAVKCGKTGYSISSRTVENCSSILEREMGLFSNVRTVLLMGDTAIKAMNYITRRNIGKKVIPSGSTYKIRGGDYFFNHVKVFPSYLQTGKSYLIERSKRRMIAEDIRAASEYSRLRG